MIPIAVLALACAGASQAAQGLSSATLREIGRIEESLKRTEAGRILVAEALKVPRRGVARLEEGAVVSWRRGEPGELVFSLEALPRQTEWDFELAYAKELARAGMDLPLPVAEEESAAVLRQLIHALERAREDMAFSNALKRATRSWIERVKAWRATRAWVRSHLGGGAEVPGLSAKGEIERAGLYLSLFAEDPDAFYWAAEQPWRRGAHSYSWTELEDFLRLHGTRLRDVHFVEGSPYARVEGRRYPAALARAALAVARGGGRERLKEALSDLETLRAEALKERLRRWK